MIMTKSEVKTNLSGQLQARLSVIFQDLRNVRSRTISVLDVFEGLKGKLGDHRWVVSETSGNSDGVDTSDLYTAGCHHAQDFVVVAWKSCGERDDTAIIV